MTPQQLVEGYICILTAFNNGEKIQVLVPGGLHADNKWVNVVTPTWDFTKYIYRVAPAPTEYILDEDGTWDYYDGESTLMPG